PERAGTGNGGLERGAVHDVEHTSAHGTRLLPGRDAAVTEPATKRRAQLRCATSAGREYHPYVGSWTLRFAQPASDPHHCASCPDAHTVVHSVGMVAQQPCRVPATRGR